MNPVGATYETLRSAGHDAISSRLDLVLRAWTAFHRTLRSAPGPERRSRDALASIRSLFDIAPFAYLSTDRARRLVRVNRHAATMFGAGAEELLGRPSLSLYLPGASRRRAAELMDRFFDGTPVDGEELEMVSRDGRAIPVVVSAVAEHDRQGAVVRSRTVAIDIRARTLMTAELQRAGRIEALERLACGIGHDLNNLLGAIRGHTALAFEGNFGSRFDVELRRIEALVDRAVALNARLFDFGARDAGAREPIRIGEFLESRRSLLAEVAGPAVTVVMRLPADLGVVQADPVDLERILVNLVVNARDAMPAGGRIVLAATNQGPSGTAGERPPADRSHVLILVKDSGPGVDPALRERIFEPFVTSKVDRVGTGLGLGSARELAERHGGRVDLDDGVAGVGATFAVRLPRVDPVA